MGENVVELVGISRLGGFEGSNPEIYASYPEFEDFFKNEDRTLFLEKTLPSACKPDTFSIDKIKDKYILSYIFALRAEMQGVRDDLASITVVVPEKQVNIIEFEKLFRLIIDSFKWEMEKLTPVILKTMIERIYSGVNGNQKIKLVDADVDIPGLIKNKKLKIKKESKSMVGKLF